MGTKDRQKILISVKWQQVSGTAEQKVPFEIIGLADAVLTGEYAKAYLVLDLFERRVVQGAADAQHGVAIRFEPPRA